jgi:hypothetical protein
VQRRNILPVPDDPKNYPTTYGFDSKKGEVAVGNGRFGPVSSEVWEFEVSGFSVVQSWLGYRMKVRSGKKSSALDDIRPERWTARMTDEFLELLWVIEETLIQEPKLSAALDAIVASQCFAIAELPYPTEAERRPLVSEHAGGELLALMEVEKPEDDD